MVPLSHLVEPPHQPDQVHLVPHLVVVEAVSPDPASKAEGDEERTGLHPVGSGQLTVGAKHQPSTRQALCLPAACPADEMLLGARTRDVLPAGHAGRAEVHLDGQKFSLKKRVKKP